MNNVSSYLFAPSIGDGYANNMLSPQQLNLSNWTATGDVSNSYDDGINFVSFEARSHRDVPAKTAQDIVDSLATYGITISLSTANDFIGRIGSAYEGKFETNKPITYAFMVGTTHGYSDIIIQFMPYWEGITDVEFYVRPDLPQYTYAIYNNDINDQLEYMYFYAFDTNTLTVGSHLGSAGGGNAITLYNNLKGILTVPYQEKSKDYTAPNGISYKYKYDVYYYGNSGVHFDLYSNILVGLNTRENETSGRYRMYVFVNGGMYPIYTNYESNEPVIGDRAAGTGTYVYNENDLVIYYNSGRYDTPGVYQIYGFSSSNWIIGNNINNLYTIFDVEQATAVAFNGTYSLTSFPITIGKRYEVYFEVCSPTGFIGDSCTATITSGLMENVIQISGSASSVMETKNVGFIADDDEMTIVFNFDRIQSSSDVIIKITNLGIYEVG